MAGYSGQVMAGQPVGNIEKREPLVIFQSGKLRKVTTNIEELVVELESRLVLMSRENIPTNPSGETLVSVDKEATGVPFAEELRETYERLVSARNRIRWMIDRLEI